MTDKPMTATEVMDAKRDRERAVRWALTLLLDKLRRYITVYTLHPAKTMPAHDVAWYAYTDGGPERVILDVLKTNPELWLEAVPEGVCLVPREMLRTLVHPVTMEALESYGKAAIQQHAARQQHEQEEQR